MNDPTFAALILTAKLALCSTLILLLIGVPLAWCLAHSRAWWRAPLNALVTLPLVLPPSVLGFYLLVAMGPEGPLGRLSSALGWGLWSFSFTGLLIGSVVYSLPFAVQPVQAAFQAQGRRPLEVAATLGASPVDAFFNVALPQAASGVFTAAVLCFAHTVGEFGVVLMIGGNIPGQTQVISTLIYGHVEAMDYVAAHRLAAGMVVFSFAVLLLVSWRERREQRG